MTSKEDFSWSDEAKKLKGVRIITPMVETKKEFTQINIDRSTLPKDGQRISFQTENEKWHEGYFVEGDDFFWVNESTWYTSFNVIQWKYI